jgi:hypothetical protein
MKSFLNRIRGCIVRITDGISSILLTFFRGLSQSLHANAGMLFDKDGTYPFDSFLIHSSSIALSFDAVQS